MKTLICILFLSCFVHPSLAQNISGKWIGKITQLPGGYSQLYDFELDLTQKKSIWGDSYAYFKDDVMIRIGLSGYADKDTFRLYESKDWIRMDKVPTRWIACIKNINVAYHKDDVNEYLEGSWKGTSKDNPNDICLPGRVILSRTVEGLNKFLHENRDSVVTAEAPSISEEPPVAIDFKESFLNTEPKKVTEIVVNHTDLKLQLIDYLKVDNDTVSIYLNRKPLVRNVWISKRATVINFKLDPRIHTNEILLYAENLGQIPPNTSELLITDGENTHRIMIVSDKQKTAAIYLRYKPLDN